MKEEKLIQKWIAGDLSLEEKRELEQLDSFKDYLKIDTAAQYFKAPEFNTDSTYQNIQHLKTKKNSTNWLYTFSKIAAVLVIAFLGYQLLFSSSLKEINAEIASREQVVLPDQSIVQLNASSYLAYNEDKWAEKRNLDLQGEAFFKVAHGKKFTVNTPTGSVSVKGTQFNIKQRKDIFIVTCFEGLVEVTTPTDTVLLAAGKEYSNIYSTKKLSEITAENPDWLTGESNFKSIPLAEVFNELERQYNLHIQTKNLTFDTTNKNFTGSFVHHNLEQALKAVTIPFQLSYKIEGNSVSITKSE